MTTDTKEAKAIITSSAGSVKYYSLFNLDNRNKSTAQVKIAIIGTAFRDEMREVKFLNRELYEQMKKVVEDIITLPKTKGGWGLNKNEVILVSGGAAGADAVAVSLFLNGNGDNYRGIEIYGPGAWNDKNKKFDEEQQPNCRVANYYHGKFYTKTNINTLKELSDLYHQRQNESNSNTNTNIYISEEPMGFKLRNSAIAKNCDRIIALTFHNDREHLESMKTGGGTQDTWKKAGKYIKDPNLKKHVNLNNFIIT
jgi:hypothetical protein